MLTIKAQRFRTQERNRDDALARLAALIEAARTPVRARRPTREDRDALAAEIILQSYLDSLAADRGDAPC